MRPRQPWDDDRFETEVRSIADELGRFPTVSDLKGMDRNDLANQITRRGGFPAVVVRQMLAARIAEQQRHVPMIAR